MKDSKILLCLFSFFFTINSQAQCETITLVEDINPGVSDAFSPGWGVINTIEYDSKVFFNAENAASGEELWETDGSSATIVADLRPGAPSGGASNLTVYEDKLYFVGEDAINGREVWEYNGVSQTPLDVVPGSLSSDPDELVVMGGILYFVATTSIYGRELWKYDGLSYSLAVDINLGFEDSNPANLIVYDSELYFRAYTAASGTELWKFDGTTATLIEIEAGAVGGAPANFYEFDSKLYFQAGTSTEGTEFYEYDGTTLTSYDLEIGAVSSSPNRFTEYNGNLYFTATTLAEGSELWMYDGTSAPSLFQDINPGTSGSGPSNYTIFNDELVFTANDGTSGNELWHSDGTSTSILVDVNPGVASSSPNNLIVLNFDLYFGAEDGTTGNGIKKYDDGTITTFEALDGGAGGFNAPIIYDSTILFVANSTINGYEMYRLESTDEFEYKDSLICEGDSLMLAGSYQLVSGTYYDHYTGGSSCDSTVITNLIVVDPDTSVSIVSGTIYSNASGLGVEYNWMDCADSSLIVLASSQDYTPTIDGDYAVIVNDNGCIDTSACSSFIGVGMDEKMQTTIDVYPNPSIGEFYLNTNGASINRVIVYNASGQIVYHETLNSSKHLIDMSAEPRGIYFSQIITSEGVIQKQLIIE